MPEANNVIDSATAATILKWAVTILVAGFIAQFGKKFANYLMEKLRSYRRKKKHSGEVLPENEGIHGQNQGPDSDAEHTPAPFAAEKARMKLEKKRLKNEAKARKK